VSYLYNGPSRYGDESVWSYILPHMCEKDGE